MRPLNYACKASLTLTTFAVLGFVTCQPASAASFYSITDLGVGIAEDINDSGQVVGGLGIFQQEPLRAFIWSESTGLTELGTFGSDYSLAQGINNLGQVVGFASNADGDYLAFLWSESTGLTDLGTLPGTSPYFGTQENTANAINDLGQVAGSSNREAFFYSQSTGFIAIPGLDGFGIADDINNSGQVVGLSGTPGSGINAFLWSQSTGTTELGTFGGYYTGAEGINDFGQVVGYSRVPVGIGAEVPRAFLWNEDTGLTELGTLGDLYSDSFANDINNLGQVVGSSQIASGDSGPFRAFLWENDVMTDLNSLVVNGSGWELTTAQAINEKGQIVGSGQFNGETHAFLLTPQTSPEPEPIPEPSSALGVLAFGSFAASFLLKRRRAMRQ